MVSLFKKEFLNKFINFLKSNLLIKKLAKYLYAKFIIRPRLVKQLYFENIVSKKVPYKGKKILVPLIETTHPSTNHILIIAKALQIRGALVKVLVCDEFLAGCEIKSFKNKTEKDNCWECRLNRNLILPLYGLDIIKLSDFVSDKEFLNFQRKSFEYLKDNSEININGINLSSSVDDSIMRYYFGKIPKEKNQIQKIKKNHILTALMTTSIAKKIDQEWSPDMVINNMSAYSAWEGFSKYFILNGNRFHAINMTPYDFYKISLDWYDLFISNRRFKKYFKYRDYLKLSNNENKLLDSFLEGRFKGKSMIFKTYGYFEDRPLDNIIKQLNFKKNKKNVFLFSNLYYDVGCAMYGRLYDNVIDWVINTVDILKESRDINLYIKPHPAEIYDSQSALKGIKDVVQEKFPQLFSNILFIDPELKIKSYDLFPLIDLGVIYSGTLGLEMLLEGVPVVCTGKVPYSDFDFLAEPNTESDYADYLNFKKCPPIPKYELLRTYAYFYFIRTRIPWNLTSRVFGERFRGFTFKNLDEMKVGANVQLDHLCKCIMEFDETVPEAWPEI